MASRFAARAKSPSAPSALAWWSGFAWTPSGGDILFVEASTMKGKGGFTITGQIQEVMRESMQAGLSWVRSNASQLGIQEDFFAEARYSHSRSGGRDSERWAVGGCDHRNRAGFAAHGASGAAVDWR